MSGNTDGQDSGLVLPEGYVAERYGDGRLRIYDTGTGSWLGEIAPHLANAQEVAEELIDAHEQSEASRDNLTLLGADEGALDRISYRQDNDALELRERTLSYHAGSERKDHALRIRELEIVAALAADSLERAGDEATAEIVRSVLRSGSE